MRPGQNKRMRGRSNSNNNRKGPNPLTRSYESNGPDVKIRGTAHHIGEKYLQLARDAQSSGDPVMAESYLQHAEHYFRLIAAAQQVQQQAAYGYQRPAGEPIEQDDDADDDFESLPDRFASPSERAPQPPAAQPFPDRPPFNGGDRQPDRQPYEPRQERYDRQQPQFDRQDRPQQGDRPTLDRSQDRQYDNRNTRGGYQDRSNQDRGNQERNGPANQQDRPNQDRNNQDRNNQDRGNQERGNQDRPPRDYDNRNFRSSRGPRDFRENGQPGDARQAVVEEPANGLPAFITAPTRVQPESVASEPAAAHGTGAPAPETGDDEAGFHLRPRRRRRTKSDFAGGGEGEGNQDAPATDPVGE